MGRPLIVRFGEDTFTVEISTEGHAFVKGEGTFETVRTAPGRYRTSDGFSSWEVFVAGPPDAPRVFLGGRVWELEIVAEEGRRKRPASAGDLEAPMPATVTAIVAAPGQHVRRGDILVKLEAMKMELPLRAPGDGVVVAINCSEGDLVQPGVTLVDLRPPDGDA
jgi:acetyl/propionyl-CoA carboxylase alpha subunit